jgi:hypothetical protein
MAPISTGPVTTAAKQVLRAFHQQIDFHMACILRALWAILTKLLVWIHLWPTVDVRSHPPCLKACERQPRVYQHQFCIRRIRIGLGTHSESAVSQGRSWPVIRRLKDVVGRIKISEDLAVFIHGSPRAQMTTRVGSMEVESRFVVANADRSL